MQKLQSCQICTKRWCFKPICDQGHSWHKTWSKSSQRAMESHIHISFAFWELKPKTHKLETNKIQSSMPWPKTWIDQVLKDVLWHWQSPPLPPPLRGKYSKAGGHLEGQIRSFWKFQDLSLTLLKTYRHLEEDLH